MADEDNVIKIMVATDNHLGYNEKHGVLGDDSFIAFEEILQLCQKKDVDFLLLGGDLFHDNKPSANTYFKCLSLLRKYCMGDKSVSIEFKSSPEINFNHCPCKEVNYMDPCLNISIPVFSIHGNHDDPSGLNRTSALDIVSASGLINYFGKCTDLKHVEIYPLLFQKGSTKVAVYGLSHIRDERLSRLMKSQEVEVKTLKDQDEWYNILVLHQNRAKRSEDCYIPESELPNFMDFVVWGHEHDCRAKPEWNDEKQFFVSQPGSSVPTSLCEGEAIPKNVILLKIMEKKMKYELIPLESVRPFLFQTLKISQLDIPFSTTQKKSEQIKRYLQQMIETLLDETLSTRLTGHPMQPLLPLARIRIEYDEEDQPFHPTRLALNFSKSVANYDTMILMRRMTRRGRTSDFDEVDNEVMDCVLAEQNEEEILKVETVVKEYFERIDSNPLKVLSVKSLVEAVGRYVDLSDTDALSDVISLQITKTTDHLMKLNVTSEKIDEKIDEFMRDRLCNVDQEGAEIQKFLTLANRSKKLKCNLSLEGQDGESDSEVPSIPERVVVQNKRGRGGRGGKRGNCPPVPTSTKRGLDSNAKTPRGKKQNNSITGYLQRQKGSDSDETVSSTPRKKKKMEYISSSDSD